MTRCIWDISLDSHVFLPPACEPAAWGTTAFLIREKTFSILPLVSSLCVPPRPFAFLVSMSIHRVLWKWRLCRIHFHALRTALQLGRKAQPSCEWEGVGARVVTSKGTRWHLGCRGGLGTDRVPLGWRHSEGCRTLGLYRGALWGWGLLYPRCFSFFFSPPLFWSRFCCIHAVLQTIDSVHRLQQLYFHASLTGAVFWGVSVPLLKWGWWEYGGWSNCNCNLSALFDFFTETKCLVPVS